MEGIEQNDVMSLAFHTLAIIDETIVVHEAATGNDIFFYVLYICFLSILRRLYSRDLKSGRVWILNGRKEVRLQMFRISNGIRNPEAQLFEIWTKDWQPCC